jgi:hypothetical protein
MSILDDLEDAVIVVREHQNRILKGEGEEPFEMTVGDFLEKFKGFSIFEVATMLKCLLDPGQGVYKVFAAGTLRDTRITLLPKTQCIRYVDVPEDATPEEIEKIVDEINENVSEEDYENDGWGWDYDNPCWVTHDTPVSDVKYTLYVREDGKLVENKSKSKT